MRHEGARRAAGDDQLLVDQALIGSTDSAPRHPELSAQIPPGRQPGPGVEPPLTDRLANGRHYLIDQGNTGFAPKLYG
ncbi:hypothetical protein D3C85_1465800 [compost metagenome]